MILLVMICISMNVNNVSLLFAWHIHFFSALKKKKIIKMCVNSTCTLLQNELNRVYFLFSGTSKLQSLMFSSIHGFRPEGQIWDPVRRDIKLSIKISNDQELIQSDPTSCPQNQKGNN